ncbi:MAG TPA: ATP-binding protein [Methylomirabilota bacterium]|jgi:signal transduction histidine kinase
MNHPSGHDTIGRERLNPAVVFLLTRTPMGRLVHWVARVRASVHTKLLVAFLLTALLFIGLAAISLQTIARMTEHSRLLDEAHQRVHWAQEIEHALARQMHFTAQALLLRQEGTVARILRENNRFNDTLAKLEGAARPAERELIQQIRARQEEAMNTVADIANAIRDGRLDEAQAALLGREDRVYREIDELVARLVEAEGARMASLRNSVEAANQRSLVVAACFAVAAVSLALLLGFIISWSFVLPVREAHAFLARLTAGDLGTTIAVPNRDEFGDLAGRMNQMSQELQRLVGEQEQAAAELRRLNARLEQASRAKSEFLANMSHELRTPMNAILGFTEMLLDGLYGEVSPELREPLADIQANGRHLLRLINDVLDLSKIEAGRLDLVVDAYAVADVVESVRASLRSLAAEKGLEFVTRVPPDLPTAYGDGRRITQCLLNLAGNAIKFTRQGRVEISVDWQGHELLYRVSDTGIGIPQAELENVFGEFRQVDPTVTREFGGTGLGLSITKKFVELHGGRIGVESELGKGSLFWFVVALEVGRPS